MKSIVTLSVVAVLASTVVVQAKDLQDVTGPAAGDSLCYRCRYAGRPTVSIFTRKMDDNVKELVKQIDKVVGENKGDKMAAFVVLLSDEPESQEATLKATAKDEGIVNTPLTTFENSKGPRKYRISEDAEVTVMMWVDDVKVNHAFPAGKLDKDSIKKIVSDTSRILN